MFPTFKTLDEIPEKFRAAYEERDGEFVAKLPDTTTLDTTLTKVRAEKKEAEQRARDAEKQLGEVTRKLEAKDATGADTDKKVADMLAKWELDKNAAVKLVADEKEALAAELRTIKLDDKLKTEFLNAGGRPERADKALNDTKRHFDLIDGQIVKKDEKGEVTTEKPSEFYAKTYRAEVPEFYTGTKANGGGAQGGNGGKPATGSTTAGDAVIANPLAALQRANAQAA